MNTTGIKKKLYEVMLPRFNPPLTQTDCSFVVDAVFDILAEGVTSEGKVLISGLGTFRKRLRKGRTYRVRGKDYVIEDRFTVTFDPGAQLTRAVRA